MVKGGTFIGRLDADDSEMSEWDPVGIVVPKSENFTIEMSEFYNFNWGQSASLSASENVTDGDGMFTVTVTKLQFHPGTVTRRVRQTEVGAIFYDTSGDLTDLGEKSWLMPDFKHNRWPECTLNLQALDGISCPNVVQVRKIVFQALGDGELSKATLKLTRFAQSDVLNLIANYTLNSYLNDDASYSLFSGALTKQSVPFVTDRRYRFHYGNSLELDSLLIRVSDKYLAGDWPIVLNTNYTEVREAFVIQSLLEGEPFEVIKNGTLLADELSWASGDHLISDDPFKQELELALNGASLDRREI